MSKYSEIDRNRIPKTDDDLAQLKLPSPAISISHEEVERLLDILSTCTGRGYSAKFYKDGYELFIRTFGNQLASFTQKLPQLAQDFFRLRASEGLSRTEAAERMEISSGRAFNLEHRIWKRMWVHTRHEYFRSMPKHGDHS